jgi:hypothetical protein
MTNTKIHPAGDSIYANSLVENITGDDLLEPKQSDVSVLTDAKSRKSLRSILSKNKEARSRNSHGKVVSTTKPLEIQIQHSSRTVPNNHSSKKEPASMSSSKRKQHLQRSELEYWSGLSVRAAMAVMQANGSDKMAQKASNIVLDEATRQSGRERNGKMMRALSTKLSVALLEAGGDQKVASAAVLAVMAYENNGNGIKSAESMPSDDSSTIWTDPKARGKVSDEIGSVAPSLASTIQSSTNQSNRSEALSSTPSVASKQRKLRSIEKQITEKQRAIEEAELRNQEKEREFNERIAAMEAAAKERLAALDTQASERLAALDAKASLLEKTGATQDDRKETKSAFQSGVDEFVLTFNESFNERIAAMGAVAKESLAALDAKKAALLEKAGAVQANRQRMLADESKSAKEEVKREDKATETASTLRTLTSRFFQSFDSRSVGRPQEELPTIDDSWTCSGEG